MAARAFSLRISGEFLDSYVYSGTLCLVDIQGRLRSFDWTTVVDQVVLRQVKMSRREEVRRLLLDGRLPTKEGHQLSGELEDVSIEYGELADWICAEVELDAWPTDINVYANSLYVASDRGVSRRHLSFASHEFGSDTVQQVWSGLALRVAPNSFDRMAVAAGADGLVMTQRANREPMRQVAGGYCNDCDWQDRILVGNTSEGVFRADFPSLPKRGVGQGLIDFMRQVERTKGEEPELLRVQDTALLASWLGGSRVFSLTRDLVLVSSLAEQDREPSMHESSAQFSASLEIGREGAQDYPQELSAIRSVPFGTIAEFGDRLFWFSHQGPTEVANGVGRWRVFPRAKSYSNHLHVVSEESLTIVAFDLHQNGTEDGFGFPLDEVRE